MVSKTNYRAQESRQSGRVSFFRNPIMFILTWADGYFLNQTKPFNRIVTLVFLLVGFGLVTVLSSSNVGAIKESGNPFSGVGYQLLFAVFGLVLMVFLSHRQPQSFERFSKLIYFAGIGLQVLVLVPGLGHSVGGNANWIHIGKFVIQPSEFLKIGLILYLAQILSDYQDQMSHWRNGPLQVFIYGFGAPALVLVASKDLGTAAVMVSIVLGMIFLSGMPSKYVNGFFLITVVGMLIGGALNQSRISRISNFLSHVQVFQHPNTLDVGDWQIRHGLWALANGGLTGVGPGNSTLNWGWIPEVENDFIFTNIAEEWGMIGALVVLFVIMLLGKYIRNVAQGSESSFGAMVAIGVMLWVVLQTLINIAVVLFLLPVLGVPLPLISKGGSSIVSILIAIGIVLAFERVRSPKLKANGKR